MEENSSDGLSSKYITYNGLNRPALSAGVPLMILLPMFVLGLLFAFVGIYNFGVKGITPTLGIVVVWFFIRLAVENDPNALEVISLKLKGYFLQRKKILCIK
ncbi:VirB3 family type IV secretion system protein [Hafnia paralvei]|uniref:VirB3 family type IV secretion system protein n=1 Tax=Hafnia paralvei TaxID=546367 RepID=UPI002FDBF200